MVKELYYSDAKEVLIAHNAGELDLHAKIKYKFNGKLYRNNNR